jgi:hypothetical protein
MRHQSAGTCKSDSIESRQVQCNETALSVGREHENGGWVSDGRSIFFADASGANVFISASVAIGERTATPTSRSGASAVASIRALLSVPRKLG